jgi:hypothetical protein
MQYIVTAKTLMRQENVEGLGTLGGKVKDEDCEFYEPNPNFVEREER